MRGRRPTSWSSWPLVGPSLALALVTSGCPVPPPPPTPAPAAPVIETRPDPAEARKSRPIGVGDAQAEACFAQEDTAGPCADGHCVTRCREGDAGACHELGRARLASDRACAKKLFLLACERDQHGACNDAAVLLGQDGDETKARGLAQHACEAAHGAACTTLGKLSEATARLTQLERGCELGDGEGCRLAASHYTEGPPDERDGQKAVELGERACELGDLTGCVDLAVLLAFGSGGATRDLARAESLLREVCNLDGPGDGGRSCSTLALLLAGPAIASGGTTPADTWKLHDRACQKGHVEACAMMAQHHYSEGRYGDAIAVADEVIDELPDRWSMRYARGLSLLNLGEPKRAIPDLAKLCELRQDLEYCPLWLFSARRRAGEPAEAALEAAHRRLGDEAWPEPIFRFYLGRLSQRALLTKAKDRDPRRQLEKECEAYYYVGQELLAAGQRKAAAGFFKKAVATGISEFIEYAGAGAELHLLGAAGGEPLPLTP